MPDDLTSAEIFPHIRIVMGMVIGLGVTRLLTGFAGFIQHPHRMKPYPVHLLWAATLLLELLSFWWWEVALFDIQQWTFGIFAFLVGYTIILFLLCALLFPDRMEEYSGYEDFFISRRRWFFGLFAATFIFDLIDTLIKGTRHFEPFAIEYALQIPIGLALCAIAAWTPNRRFHTVFVVGHLIYQISWFARMF